MAAREDMFTDRDEAIAWLELRGLSARPATFLAEVAYSVSLQPQDVDDELRILRRNLVVHPLDGARWGVTQYRHGGDSATYTFASLDEATRAAHSFIVESWPFEAE